MLAAGPEFACVSWVSPCSRVGVFFLRRVFTSGVQAADKRCEVNS